MQTIELAQAQEAFSQVIYVYLHVRTSLSMVRRITVGRTVAYDDKLNWVRKLITAEAESRLRQVCCRHGLRDRHRHVLDHSWGGPDDGGDHAEVLGPLLGAPSPGPPKTPQKSHSSPDALIGSRALETRRHSIQSRMLLCLATQPGAAP